MDGADCLAESLTTIKKNHSMLWFFSLIVITTIITEVLL